MIRLTANRIVQISVLTILATGLGGCAHHRECGRHHKGAPGEIMMKASEVFSNAPGLSEDQKNRLTEIYRKVFVEAMQIRREIFENKTLLFETVAKVDANSKEVEKIKTKIVELDQKRLVIMFKALTDVQSIVGFGKDKEEIYKRLREYETLGHSASTP